jgi:hypothetical protein
MRALTVCQPWAWAIIHGMKRIENRTWRTDYRGPLAIHAGKSRAWLKPHDTILPDGSHHPPASELIFGAIVGMVDVIDCIPLASCRDDPFAFGPYCWILHNPRPLAVPVPCAGHLGLWMPPVGLLS